MRTDQVQFFDDGKQAATIARLRRALARAKRAPAVVYLVIEHMHYDYSEVVAVCEKSERARRKARDVMKDRKGERWVKQPKHPAMKDVIAVWHGRSMSVWIKKVQVE